MSTFNNMDNVPVKISEKYKPPPRLFQMPQAIANRLLLPSNYYHESPQFSYDFQLERKVLSKITEWRQVRLAAREARRERKEQREQQQLRKIETHHKELLGAVSYPSADDLSSTESEEEQHVPERERESDSNDEQTMNSAGMAASTHISSFHNILQPTILTRKLEGTPSNLENTNSNTAHAGNVINAGKPLNAFNYKDFEDDTSSPFDNIELKTINDLDILAQVLNNTQLNADKKPAKEDANPVELHETKDDNADLNEHIENSNFINNAKAIDGVNICDANNSQAIAIDNIQYDQLATQIQSTENIPNAVQAPLHLSNNYVFQASGCTPYATAIQNTYMPYNNHILNGLDQQYANYNLQTQMQGLNNQNYLYAGQCNGGDIKGHIPARTYYSPSHGQMYIGSNVNRYLKPHTNAGSNSPAVFSSPQYQPSPGELSESELSLKSKSVPDILKELRDEVKNSEMRRSRNYSHTVDDSKQSAEDGIPGIVHNSSGVEGSSSIRKMEYYSSLEASTQKLAKNISSMGFPLERVAKIAQLFGADDKKIVEHLIPLSELMDLGFDEAKISEALLKFDNNKEKALEYLIS